MIPKLKSYINRRHQEKGEFRNFEESFKNFNSLDVNKKLPNQWDDIYPCLNDATSVTPFDAHYIYHPAWAARIVKKINPARHIDISSTLHFSTILSAFYPTEFYDYRPAELSLQGLTSARADLTNLFFESNSIECISCMHTIEHIGLGRYGDQLDPDGDIKAIQELKRVTKVGGDLLLVTPVGKPRIQFNAHRVYSFEIINDLFTDFDLQEFSLVDDTGKFVISADPAPVQHLSYGCGCFWYKKNR